MIKRPAKLLFVGLFGLLLFGLCHLRGRTQEHTDESAVRRATVRRIGLADKPRIETQQQRIGRLVGVVVDENEQPATTARVYVQELERWTDVDAQGRFSISDLANGFYRLVAVDAKSTSATVLAEASQTPTVCVLHLVSGGTLRVRVSDESDRAIPGAIVRIPLREAIADNDGRAELSGIPPNDVWVFVDADGFSESTRLVEVAIGETVEVAIVLRRGEHVAGVVVGPDELPVPGARVEMTLGQSDIPRGARADDGGKWSFARVASGTYSFTAHSDGYLRSKPVDVTTDGGSKDGVTLRLSYGAQLAGEVVSSSGAPVARATVWLRRRNANFKVTSSESGAFLFSGLPDGDYEVAAGGPGGVSERQFVTLFAEKRVDIVIAVKASKLAGVVVRPSGRPAAGVRVSTWCETCSAPYNAEDTTDDKGHFDFGGVPSGGYGVFASNSGEGDSEQERVSVLWNNDKVRVVLADAGGVKGRVVSAGRPVTKFGVAISDTDETYWTSATPVIIFDQEGTFRRTRVRAGKRMLVIVAPGFARLVRPIEVPSGGTLDLGDLELPSGRRIAGRVITGSGDPVSGAQIRLEVPTPSRQLDAESWDAMMQGTVTAVSDAEGRFSMSGIAAPTSGSPRIRATHDRWGTSQWREIPDQEFVTIDLVLPGASGIEGVVEGQIAPTMVAVARSISSGTLSTAPLQERRFAFDALPPGEYEVGLATSGASTLESATRVSVQEGARTSVTLRVGAKVRLDVDASSKGCTRVLLVSNEAVLSRAPCSAVAHFNVTPATYRICLDEAKASTCTNVRVDASPAVQSLRL